MTIIRRRRNRNFTVLANEIFDDEEMSLDALGLLAWLRSRPDNWNLSVEHLRRRFKVGRNKMYDLVRELVSAGWVVREQVRDPESNTWGAIEYTVLDEPGPRVSTESSLSEPRVKKRDTAKAENENAENGLQQTAEPEKCAEPLPGLRDTGNGDAVIRTEKQTNPLQPPDGRLQRIFIRNGTRDERLKLALDALASAVPRTAVETQADAVRKLEAAGFDVQTEHWVTDRGDGRRGRIDVVARDASGECVVGIELDNEVVREKSILKLSRLPGWKVAVLRSSVLTECPVGLDALVVLDHKGEALLPTKLVVSQVFVRTETPEWQAWLAHKGRSSIPSSYSKEHRAVGWFFPTRWPPGHDPPARAAAE